MVRLLIRLARLLRLLVRGVALVVTSVYKLVLRLALLIGLLFGLVHFAISDPTTARLVSELVSGEIPGSLEMGRIRAGLLLRDWEVAGVRISDPWGEPVIEARRVRFRVRIDELFAWLARLAAGEDAVRLHFTQVVVDRSRTRVDVRDPDRIPIEHTWSTPDPPGTPEEDDDEPGTLIDLRFDRVRIRDGAVEVRTGPVDIVGAGIDIQASLQVSDGGFAVRAPRVYIETGRVDLPELPGGSDLALSRFAATDARVDGEGLEVSSCGFRVGGVQVNARGGLGFGGEMPIKAELRADTSFDNPMLRALLPLEGSGPVAVMARVRESLLKPDVAADLYVEAVRFRELRVKQAGGHLLFRPAPALDGGWSARVPHLRVRTQQGTVRFSSVSGLLTLSGTPSVMASGSVELWRVELLESLARLGLVERQPELPGVVLTGGVETDVEISGARGNLSPRLKLKVGLTRPVEEGSEQIGERKEIAVSRSIELRGEPKVELDNGSVVIDASGLSIKDGAAQLKLTGTAAFPAGELDLRVRGSVPRLAEVAEPFVRLPLTGALSDLDVRLSGSLPVPGISARARVDALKPPGLPVLKGKVSARLGEDGVIRFADAMAGIEGVNAEATGSLALFKPGTWELKAQPLLRLDKLRADLRLPAPSLPEGLRGRVHALGRNIRLKIYDPVDTLSGALRVSGHNLGYEHFGVRTLDLHVSGSMRRFDLRALRVGLPGGGHLAVSGWAKGRSEASLKAELRGLDLGSVVPMLADTVPAEMPVRGKVDADLSFSGKIDRPVVSGWIAGDDLGYGTVRAGKLALALAPRAGGGARLSATVLPPGLSLERTSAIIWEGEDRRLVLGIGMEKLHPLTLIAVEDEAARPDGAEIELTGRADFELPLGAEAADGPEVSGTLPKGGLKIQLTQLAEPLTNGDELQAQLVLGDIWLPSLNLRYGQAELVGCAVLHADGTIEAAARGTVPLEVLSIQREVFSDAQGYVELRGPAGAAIPAGLLARCPMDIVGGDLEPMSVQGPLGAPMVDAEAHFHGAVIRVRDLPQEIRLPDGPGFRLTGRVAAGGESVAGAGRATVDIATARSGGVLVGFGEGSALLLGGVRLVDLKPDAMDVTLRGTELEFAAAGEYHVTANPDLRIVGSALSEPGQRGIAASGEVTITEGVYHRSFDGLARAVGGALGRSMELYARPVTETYPVLNEIALNLKVRSSNFEVTSPFPFGSAELEMDVNASMRGTLGSPELHDVVRVRPGSTITYAVIGREFEITRGTIEFAGDPEHPTIELEAHTSVEVLRADEEQRASRQDDEETVTVTIRITGTYPDVDIAFETDNPEYDEVDAQSLILTGAPARGSAESDFLSETPLNIFTEDIASLLGKLLLSPFLDQVSLGLRYGGISVQALAHMGRYLKLRTRVTQMGVDDTRYESGFQVKFTDRVSLEGKLKVLQQEQTEESSYEARLKYRIPLDE